MDANETKYLPHALPPEHLEREEEAASEELWGAVDEVLTAKKSGGFSGFSRAANRLENAAIAYGKIYLANEQGDSPCSALVSEAWNLISEILVGMPISDPRWKRAAKWLAENRQYQIVIPRLPNDEVSHGSAEKKL